MSQSGPAFIVRHFRANLDIMMDHLHRFFRQRVDVRAGGIMYNGLLIGADEEFIYMIGRMRYLMLPLESVTAVRPEGEGEGAWLMREIEGAPSRDPETIEGKRRYPKSELERLVLQSTPDDWPEQEEPRLGQAHPPEENKLEEPGKDAEDAGQSGDKND